MNNLEEVPTSSSAPETIIGSSVNVEGELKSDGDIRIEGNVTGSVKTKHSLAVGENAVIEASVNAQSAVISGTVNGNITVTDRVELSESARVTGDISSKVLSVSPGAVFAGTSKMATEDAATTGATDKTATSNDAGKSSTEANGTKARRGRRAKG
ncbi:polymer-forming cytoskeletal protein [Patescibacteria group bacterium]